MMSKSLKIKKLRMMFGVENGRSNVAIVMPATSSITTIGGSSLLTSILQRFAAHTAIYVRMPRKRHLTTTPRSFKKKKTGSPARVPHVPGAKRIRPAPNHVDKNMAILSDGVACLNMCVKLSDGEIDIKCNDHDIYCAVSFIFARHYVCQCKGFAVNVCFETEPRYRFPSEGHPVLWLLCGMHRIQEIWTLNHHRLWSP